MPRRNAAETDSLSLAAMFVLVCLCLVAGILPGYFIDALAPVVQSVVGGHLPQQAALQLAHDRPDCRGPKLLQRPAVVRAHRRRCHRCFLRHSPLGFAWCSPVRAWDCGFPDSSLATQYTAGSFAQPIRRVFGTLVFHAREEIHMPQPGDSRPASFHVHLRDRVWDVFYVPVARLVGVTAKGLNKVQFLTLRGYLTLVSGALVALLAILALWQ